MTARAYVSNHTNLLYDLQKDAKFNIANYPAMTWDYFNSLNTDGNEDNDIEHVSVIQIGESIDGELYIYTYQPLNGTSDITASSINMSVGFGSTSVIKYTLKCVSFDGVFKKYLVENFTVPSDFERYYNIIEIERPFNALFDEKISDETITDYKAHSVAQTWCCYYQNNALVYEMSTLDVVEITPTMTGFIYCENGITWGSLLGRDEGCHAHFVSFNIENYDVDKIINADLVYKKRTFQKNTTQGYVLGFKYGDPKVSVSYPNGEEYEDVPYTVTSEQEVEYKGAGLRAKTYTWHRIMTGQDFVSNYEKQDGIPQDGVTKETLSNSQFVFAFTETDIAMTHFETWTDGTPSTLSSTTDIIEGTQIAQVDILRLEFVVDGDTYNLGVVGDTTSGDDKADGFLVGLEEDEDWWQKLVALIMGGFLLLLIWPFVSAIIMALLKVAIKGVFFIIARIFDIFLLPLKLLFRSK